MTHTPQDHSPDRCSDLPFPTVAILGLGLLGGSLGLALKRRNPAPRVLGCARRPGSVDEAIKRGAIDGGGTNPADVLPEADLTVICTPVTVIVSMLNSCCPHWRPGAVVTDVGSVKAPIMKAAAHALLKRRVEFVGSHPMAGSDRSGLSHANARLYERATVFITSEQDTSSATVATVESFWETCGARTVRIGAGDHDALVARTSHLPHILAAVATRVGLAHPKALLGTAGAFRDVTRIAGSSPDMWRQIFELNRDELLAAVDEYADQLAAVRSQLANTDWEGLQRYLQEACDKRQQWDGQWHKRREEQP